MGQIKLVIATCSLRRPVVDDNSGCSKRPSRTQSIPKKKKSRTQSRARQPSIAVVEGPIRNSNHLRHFAFPQRQLLIDRAGRIIQQEKKMKGQKSRVQRPCFFWRIASGMHAHVILVGTGDFLHSL